MEDGLVPDKIELQVKAADVRLRALERAVDELKKGSRTDPGVAMFEMQLKATEKRLSGMERAMEELKKVYQTEPGVAKFEPRIVAMEKQVAVLMASTLTRKDLQVLEQARDAKDASNWAKSNKEEAEGRELARKEAKRLEALVAKIEQEANLTKIEQRLVVLQAEIKRVETLAIAAVAGRRT